MPFITGLTFGFHAMMWPDSDEKMNSAGAVTLVALDVIMKLPVGLNTWPVGAESIGGRVTVSGNCWTIRPPGLMVYKVETLVPLSATHSGVVGPRARPHAFFRLGSISWAAPLMSETRLVWRNSLCGPPNGVDADADATGASAAGIATASTPSANVRNLGNREDMGTSLSLP